MTSTDRPTRKNVLSQSIRSPTAKDQPFNSPTHDSTGRATFYNINKDMGFSKNHSASTLQHSTLSWGFARSPRFPKVRSFVDPHDPLELPTTLDKKATSFGYGIKGDAFAQSSKRAITFPGPDRYLLKSDFQNKQSGKSFGLPYSAYAKTYVPGNNTLPPEIAKDLPGPGAYYSVQIPEPKKARITFKPKGKMFNEALVLDSPPVNHYNPKTTLVDSTRFRNTSFGFGKKLDFTKDKSCNPGPGSYSLSSCFDNRSSSRSPSKRAFC